jgi:hypothetical protein
MGTEEFPCPHSSVYPAWETGSYSPSHNLAALSSVALRAELERLAGRVHRAAASRRLCRCAGAIALRLVARRMARAIPPRDANHAEPLLAERGHAETANERLPSAHAAGANDQPARFRAPTLHRAHHCRSRRPLEPIQRRPRSRLLGPGTAGSAGVADEGPRARTEGLGDLERRRPGDGEKRQA